MEAKIITLCFAFVGSMVTFIFEYAIGHNGLPSLDATIAAGVQTVVIIGVCMLLSEVVFKTSFLGTMFGIAVAVMTHPSFDYIMGRMSGSPLARAQTDLLELLLHRCSSGFVLIMIMVIGVWAIKSVF